MRRKTGILLAAIVLGMLLAAGASAEGIQINACMFQTNGLVHLEWTAAEGAEAYEVTSYVVPSGTGNEYYVEKATVSGTSAEMYGIPGSLMRFVVKPEGSDLSGDASVGIPVNKIDDIKVTSSVQLKRTRSGKSTRLNSFSSFDLSVWLDDLATGHAVLDDLSYDVRFGFRMPKLGRERVYNVLLTLEAPNGCVAIVMYESQSQFNELSTLIDWYYDVSLAYPFYQINSSTGGIPTGTYKITMYYDGRLATSSTFKVDN